MSKYTGYRPIAFSGAYGSGKSTAAQKIGLFTGMPILSLATALREELIEKGILTREQAYGKPTSDWVRKILIDYSAERRSLDPMCWVKAFDRAYGYLNGFVVDDVRRVIELEYMVSKNAIVVFLGLPGDNVYELEDIYERADIRLPQRPSRGELLNIHFSKRG